MRIEAAIEAYLEYLRRRGASPRTVALSGQALQIFSDVLKRGGLQRIQEISGEHIWAYKQSLREYRYWKGRAGAPRPSQGLSANSQSSYFYRVRSFCKFLFKSKLLLYNPAAGVVGFRKQTMTKRIPGEKEIGAFLDTVSGESPVAIRDRAMLELFYSSGLRLSELQKLDVYDVDLNGGFVRVREGKGRKERIVPVGEVALKWIRRYLEHAREDLLIGCGQRKTASSRQMALFLSQMGRRIAPVSIQRRIELYSRKAGVTLSAHLLRHACATHMLAGGADVRYVQELLGHTSVATTQMYTRVTITDLKRVHGRCHPREKEAEKIVEEEEKGVK